MRVLGQWLSSIILALVVVFLLIALAAPLVFSSRVAVVLSGSMGKALPPGALAVSVPVDPEVVQIGDIITFTPSWDPDVTVSHRVVEVVNDEDGQLAFRTKGDTNEDPDSWVMPAENVTGKVAFHVPYLGYAADSAMKYVHSWAGFALLVALPSLILISSAFRDVKRNTNRRKKRLKLCLEQRRRR